MGAFIASRVDYLSRIWALRYFWFSLVRNDMRNRYRRSFLGIGWSLIRPLSTTIVFCVVFGKLFRVSFADYAPFLLVGMTIWQFFSESLIQGCQSFITAGAYIRQQPVPLAIFPLRNVIGSGFHTTIALSAAVAIAVFLRGTPNPAALIALVPALVLLFLLGWFLCIVSSTLHTHFPDTQHLLEIGIQLLFYMTPVLYRPEDLGDRGRFVWFLEMNPMTSVLAIFRAPIIDGTFPTMHAYMVTCGLVLFVGALAWAALAKMERTLVFWV